MIQAARPAADCRLCPRLAAHREILKREHPDYHNAPVAAFGDPDPSLLIVGLAPGRHGANATGRPFTGDYAGILLYRTLHAAGFASRPESVSVGDGLELRRARITNAVKCLPPENKPTTREVDTCLEFLTKEIASLKPGAVILALGTIAHRAVVRACGGRLSDYRFGHGNQHRLPDGRRMIDSYHCSRYNTQTGRLTEQMFVEVLASARRLVLA